jgi:hypothetical protein
MRLCGANDEAFSAQLVQLCKQIGARQKARLAPATAALSIEGMIDGLWQNFLVGPPGFKREPAIAAVFELLDTIYPPERQEIDKM